MSFGGFSSHLGPTPGGGGALGALAMGPAPGGGFQRRNSPMGHILEGAVGVVERRKRSVCELSGSIGDAHGQPFTFSGREKFDNIFLLFSYFILIFLIFTLLSAPASG